MSHEGKVWVALGTVYVLWGSTYLGIELAGETIPPLFAVGWRFIVAGTLMAAWVAWRRGASALHVSRRELGSAALIGLLLPGANALLFVAERDVPIGLASLVIASVPLLVVALRFAGGDRPTRGSLIGVAVGFAGIALLVRPGGDATAQGLALVVGSALAWAVGSYLSGRLPLPRDVFAATALEMLAGGVFLLPIGLLATDFEPSEWSARSILGWWYLVVFGSLFGYTAYVWLLHHAPIGKVATYAYVNPVVAIALGVVVLHESLSWRVLLGATIVLASVAAVVRKESVPAETEAAPAGAARVPD
ncbi:MAG TPA: EamA family transporter [Gaiellaceae bacterium]|nr:EamA family transporter [Gaiellaceae bacterium]